MEKVCIIGAGGHGRVILDILNKSADYQVVGFIDDQKEPGTLVDDVPVLGDFQNLLDKRYTETVIVGIGNNQVRRQKYENIIAENFKIINAVHPTVIINSNVTIGTGNVLVAGVIINPGAVIGNNVILNTGATIGHDVQISDHVHISPGVNLCGHSIVGEESHIGAGAAVIPLKVVGSNCVVGAGAVIVDNIPNGKLVMGVPGKCVGDL